MIDNYTICYKETLPVDDDWPQEAQWDTFISAFTSAERVQRVFDKAHAAHKHWLVFSEYAFSPGEYPADHVFNADTHDEVEFVTDFWHSLGPNCANGRICVDITGFIRPYLCFLIRWFMSQGVRRFDAIYSEPAHYAKREETTFSDGPVIEVRQVKGFEGIHETDGVDSKSKDVLIVNVGYDDRLIAQVAESKESSRKIRLFGFPSLRADMYQENVLRAYRAKESLGESDRYFAPANDPFVTASVLREIVKDVKIHSPISNLYLCPLATKAQTLGFALYYLNECLGSSASLLFPFSDFYSQETSTGCARIWKYSVELPHENSKRTLSS
jgi:hypothetical protein